MRAQHVLAAATPSPNLAALSGLGGFVLLLGVVLWARWSCRKPVDTACTACGTPTRSSLRLDFACFRTFRCAACGETSTLPLSRAYWWIVVAVLAAYAARIVYLLRDEPSELLTPALAVPVALLAILVRDRELRRRAGRTAAKAP